MKKFLLAALLFPTFILTGQITLNQADFATGSDTIRMSQSTDLTLDFLSTGPNSNWDYSSLIPSSQKVKNFRPSSSLSFLSSFIFGTFAPTRYKASYFIESTDLPIAQIGTILGIPISDVFAFSRVTADSVTSIGFSMVADGTEIPFKSDTIEKRYDFPIQFANTTFSRGYTSIDLNPTYDAIFLQHRQHSSTVDGWGSITTPYGTFNALRIKHEITELDSIYVGAFSFWLPIPVPPSNVYEWWTNGQKEPILRIKTSTILGTETATSIEYRDQDRGLDAGLTELNSEFSIFPNPVKDQLSVLSEKLMDKVLILDITGKEIKNITISPANQMQLNISDLEKGVYYLKVISSNTIGIKSFVKE